jgi:hypothetical protein
VEPLLNSRELASAIWLFAFVVFALSLRDVRSGAVDVLKVASHWKIWLPLLTFTAYVGLLLVIGAEAGSWNRNFTVDTLVWYFGTALVLLFNATRAAEPGFFRRTAVRTIEVAVFLGFYFNLFVFPLAIEFILVPMMLVLTAASVVANGQTQFTRVKRAIDGLLAFVALAVALYVAYRLVHDWRTVAEWDTLAEFAVPIWLTVAVLPFIFALGVVATYETAFVRVDFVSQESSTRRRVKLAMIWAFKVRLEDVAQFGGRWAYESAEAQTFSESVHVLRSYQAARRARQA